MIANTKPGMDIEDLTPHVLAFERMQMDRPEEVQAFLDDFYMRLPVNQRTESIGPDIPACVRRSVFLYFASNNKVDRALHILENDFHWYGDCWGFSYAGMFFGIERDGYMHT